MSDPDLDLVSRQRQLRELVSRLAEQSPHEAIPRIATPRFIIPSLVFWHGRLFTPARLPADIERGRSQDCYRNALFLTIEHPGWTYAEGYGLVEDGAVPHAWAVADGRMVIDQTWPKPESKAYFGIEFHEATLNTWPSFEHGWLSPLDWLAATIWHQYSSASV